MSDLKSQIAEEVANIDWKDLIPHAQRDALILIDCSLNLLDVAVAIANNDVSAVQSWIGNKLIHKPTVEELSEWNIEPEKKFTATIVQPFVLAKIA
jgi:hypothetical protein